MLETDNYEKFKKDISSLPDRSKFLQGETDAPPDQYADHEEQR